MLNFNFAECQQDLTNVCKVLTNVEIAELRKVVHCVDLDESFQMSIYYLLAKFGFDRDGVVLARRKAPYCELTLRQFGDAKVVTIDLMIHN